MINAILKGIISLIIGLVSLILTPIDNLILTALPNLSNALTGVGNFLNLISNGIGWAVSLTGLSNEALSLIVMFFTFKLTAPMLFYMIKLALSWYNKLKPQVAIYSDPAERKILYVFYIYYCFNFCYYFQIQTY